MMRKLRFGRKGPALGQAKALVVFLHGYGADGTDLLGLADVLGPHLPGAAFLAPDAPERCAGGGFGYQWFPIPWLDGSPLALAEAGLDAAAVDLNGFLDACLGEEGLTPDRLALIGFSQGAMISLHVALRRPTAVAGVVAISGRLLRPERLAREVVATPPVLLMHGDEDAVVPFEDMERAGKVLVAAGVPCFGHVMRGTGHGIAPDGLGAALRFLSERFGQEQNP
jgi:phospholipase/carboxylesterase